MMPSTHVYENPFSTLSPAWKWTLGLLTGAAVVGGIAYAVSSTPAKKAPAPGPVPPVPPPAPNPPPPSAIHPLPANKPAALVLHSSIAVDRSALTAGGIPEVQAAINATIQSMFPVFSFASYLMIPGVDPTTAPNLWAVTITPMQDTTIEDLNAALQAGVTTSLGLLDLQFIPGAVQPTLTTTVSSVSVVGGPQGSNVNVAGVASGSIAASTDDIVAYLGDMGMTALQITLPDSAGNWSAIALVPPNAAGNLVNMSIRTDRGTLSFVLTGATPQLSA